MQLVRHAREIPETGEREQGCSRIAARASQPGGGRDPLTEFERGAGFGIEAVSTGAANRVLALGFRTPATTEAQAAAEATSRRVAKACGILGIPTAIGVHGGTGAIFAVVISRPYWNSGLFPIMFLVSALASGAALAVFLYAVLGRRDAGYKATLQHVASLMVLFISLDALLVAADFLAGAYQSGTEESRTLLELATGQFRWLFWGGEVGLALVLPVLLVATARGSPLRLGLAGLSAVVGIGFVRYDLVVPAYALPVLPGLDAAYQDPRFAYAYAPSSVEWLVALGIVSLLILAFVVALEVLPLGDSIRRVGAKEVPA